MPYHYADDFDTLSEQKHPACPGRCGNLADECMTPLRCRQGPAPLPAPVEYDDDLGPASCRGWWKGKPCTDPAYRSGYCDMHYEKYSE